MNENTIEILILAHDIASNVLSSIGDEAGSLGDKFTNMGASMTVATAGVAAALANATAQATTYDESLTNTAAVLGLTRDEQAALSQEILDFSRDTRAGPQQVADAFYDIVGGVADASTHMAILTAATNTAEAGNADLAGTTAGLVSIMNSYKFAAEDAGFASDVLTQVVGAGVGTMDEFASALPNVTGLASSLGISFDNVGGSMAYLTTQGFSASQAATQLQSMMTSLLNPNVAMTEALNELGFATGQAAIDSLGLVGAMGAISDSNAALENGLAATLGSVEALNGTIALTTDEASAAMLDFTTSVDGATEAAQAIQMTSTAAQMDLLQSSMSAIAIQIGTALLPSLNNMLEAIDPILDGVFDWISANPQLVSTILGVVSAVVALGPILTGIGLAIGVLTSPITLVIGAVAALAAAWATDFGGIQEIVQPILDNISEGFAFFTDAIGWFVEDIQTMGLGNAILAAFGIGPEASGESWVEGVIATFLGAGGEATGAMRDLAIGVSDALGGVASFIITTVIPTLQMFAEWFTTTGLPLAVAFVTDVVVPGIQTFIAIIVGIWQTVQPGLVAFAEWFTVTALPAAVNFITGTVIPGIQSLIATVMNVWTQTQPLLQSFFEWFTVTALPAISTFITGTVVPIVETLISTIIRVWNDVSPFLYSLADWFITSALPAIVTFIETIVIPIIGFLIDKIIGIWTGIQPTLISIYDWFITSGLPFITTAIDAVTVIFGLMTTTIAGIWTTIEPILSLVYDWFITTGLNLIDGAINGTITVITSFIDAFTTIWTAISPFLTDLQTGMTTVFDWITINIIQPFIDIIDGIGAAWADVQAGLVDAAAFFGIDIGISSSGSRDIGGTGYAGQSYMIGTGAQPEAFIPRTAGSFIPNVDQLGGNTTEQTSYQVSVSVTERELLTQEDAEANGEILGRRVMEELNYRG